MELFVFVGNSTTLIMKSDIGQSVCQKFTYQTTIATRIRQLFSEVLACFPLNQQRVTFSSDEKLLIANYMPEKKFRISFVTRFREKLHMNVKLILSIQKVYGNKNLDINSNESQRPYYDKRIKYEFLLTFFLSRKKLIK